MPIPGRPRTMQLVALRLIIKMIFDYKRVLLVATARMPWRQSATWTARSRTSVSLKLKPIYRWWQAAQARYICWQLQMHARK